MQKLQLRSMLQAWLEEDLGSGDITSELLVFGQQANAIIHAKEEGVIAGLEAAAEVFRLLDPEVQFRCLVADGEAVQAGAQEEAQEADAEADAETEEVVEAETLAA